MPRLTMSYVDNSGAVELSRDRKSCNRTRHIDRRYFKVRELNASGVIEVRKVPTDDNPADLLTKALPFPTFEKHTLRVTGAAPVSPRGEMSGDGKGEARAKVARKGPATPPAWKLATPLYGVADAGRIWNRYARGACDAPGHSCPSGVSGV